MTVTSSAPAVTGARVGRRPSSSTKRSARLGLVMSIPAFVVVAAVTVLPILAAVFLSFFQVNPVPGSLELQWAGMRNYSAVLSSSATRDALSFTTVFTVVSVLVQLFLGTLVALAIDAMSRGRAAVLALLLIPYSMISVIAARLWGYIANGVFGVGNYILQSLHLIDGPVNFLGSTKGAFVVALIADSWKTIPFVTLIVLAGLRMIDRGLYEAAELDGANWLARTLRITLPLLWPTIMTAAVFRILHAFGIFDLMYVLTGGGPGTSTVTVSMLTYNALFQDLDIGRAATISSVATFLMFIVALCFIKPLRRQAAEGVR